MPDEPGKPPQPQKEPPTIPGKGPLEDPPQKGPVVPPTPDPGPMREPPTQPGTTPIEDPPTPPDTVG